LIYHANFSEYLPLKFNLITAFMIATLIKLSVLIFYYCGSFMGRDMDTEELLDVIFDRLAGVFQKP